MNSSVYSQNICRICLGNNVKLNWNDEISEFCGISYKDCYYKYTKLEETDPDCYPTNLCDKCAEELRSAHILFERALESFNMLQDFDKKYSDTDKTNSVPAARTEILAPDVDYIRYPDDKTYINTEELCISSLCEDENGSSDSSKISKLEEVTVEPTLFIDIQHFGSPVEIPLEVPPREICDSEIFKSSACKSGRKKGKKYDLTSPAVLAKEDTTFDNLPCSTKRTRRRKRNKSLKENSLNREANGDCNFELPKYKTEDTKNNDNELEKVKSLDDCALENFEQISSSTKPAKKSREKYLLMCSYCSLKVDGAKKLEKHEATHNENRERTVTCPQCGLKLYTDWSLSLHMKIHDKNRQKNHKCEFCEKAFFNKGALNVHRRIHLGLMIKCHICEKEFFRQVDLDKHLLKHSASPLEKNVGKKRYVAQCQYCKNSVLTDKLKEHIAVHLDQPQVKCKICDKNFFSRTKCTNHLRRFHLKNLSEYEEFIHYYVDRNKRLSSLMIKQQLVVQPLKE